MMASISETKWNDVLLSTFRFLCHGTCIIIHNATLKLQQHPTVRCAAGYICAACAVPGFDYAKLASGSNTSSTKQTATPYRSVSNQNHYTHYRTSRSSEYQVCYVFERSRLHI
jgi:hypothetical protein